MAQNQLISTARAIGLDEDCFRVLMEPMRELHVSFPVKMDTGEIRVFSGFRVQHNDARGPTKGGIRFHPEEDINTIRALAMWMTWKTALMNLPLGGGKGGVICDPKELSVGEQEKLCRGYVKAVGDFIGPNKDIPAPDVNTTAQHMAWMMDEYSGLHSRYEAGSFTGKPPSVSGCPGRDDATARGGLYCLEEALRKMSPVSLLRRPMTVAIQGYGNAGKHMAHLLGECKIIAVSDSKGGVINPKGLHLNDVDAQKRRTRSVIPTSDIEGYGGHISNNDLLGLNVDILVLAAIEGVITKENAGNVHARIIVELANGPITPEADTILQENRVLVIPDILANAGGVVVSYFEMVQNYNHTTFKLEDVQGRLQTYMEAAYDEVHEMAKTHKFTLRKAAYCLAVSRVAEAMRTRGIV